MNVIIRAVLVFAMILIGAASAAAEAGAPLYVRAGRLVDVLAARVLEDQLITIEGERIVAVAPYAPPAEGAEVLDWSDYTVLPGLMDMHTHLIGDIQGSHSADPLTTSAAFDALAGAANARATLRAGFTTVRDVGAWRAFTDVALRDAINRGFVEGPRMSVAGAYLTIPGGGGEITGLAPDVTFPAEFRRGVARNADEMRDAARGLLNNHVDFLKLIATGAVLTEGTEPGQIELTEAEIRAAVEEAARRGTYATAHAHGAEGIKTAVRAGVRSIEHGSLVDEEGLKMMKAANVWLVADVYNGDYIDEVGTRDGWPAETLRKNTETTQAQRDGFRRAVELGVPIAFGTDAGVFPHGDNAKQFRYMVENGMTPMQAVQAATISSATLMGEPWVGDVGAVAPGRFADLIGVEGDPLADVSRLERVAKVMKGGELVKDE